MRKLEDYLEVCGLALPVKLGLSVFYRKHNREMDAYMCIYLLAMKTLRGAKAFLRKLLK